MVKQTTIKGVEQGRASYAYLCALEGNEIEKKQEYKAYAKKLPVLIKTNGLAAALSFVKSKREREQGKRGYAYYLLYQQVAEWLQRDEKQLVELTEDSDLVNVIINLPSPVYRAVTGEVLAFLSWLRRFAEGLIEGDAINEQ